MIIFAEELSLVHERLMNGKINLEKGRGSVPLNRYPDPGANATNTKVVKAAVLVQVSR